MSLNLKVVFQAGQYLKISKIFLKFLKSHGILLHNVAQSFELIISLYMHNKHFFKSWIFVQTTWENYLIF